MPKLSFTKLLFVLCIVSLSLGQFVLITKSDGIAVYMFDIFVGIFSVFGFISILLLKKKIFFTWFHVNLFLFTFISLISLLLRVTSYDFLTVMASSFYLVRWMFYMLGGYVVYLLIKNEIFTFAFVLEALKYSALFVAISGFIQLFLLPDFTVLDETLGWDPHKNRLAATFFDPNFVGGYLAFILGLFTSLIYWKKYSPTKVDYFIFLLILVALVLTFSRSSWGMYAVTVLGIGVLKSRKLFLLALILLFCTYFFIPRIQTRISGITDPSDSAAFRLISWKNTLEIARDNPLIGVGFNFFRYVQSEYGFIEAGSLGGNNAGGSDSSFLLVVATTGIFGLLFFTMAYFSFGNIYLLPLGLGLFLHSQFVNSLFYPPILFLWLIVWGLSIKD